jgi:hypothetical protein
MYTSALKASDPIALDVAIDGPSVKASGEKQQTKRKKKPFMHFLLFNSNISEFFFLFTF